MTEDDTDAARLGVLQAAASYRWVIGSLAVAYVCWGFSSSLRTGGNTAWSAVAALAAFAAYVTMLVSVYRLAAGLGQRGAWAWVVAMFVPCANILVLLILSSRATAFFRARGISVGILGPDMSEVIEYLDEDDADLDDVGEFDDHPGAGADDDLGEEQDLDPR